MPHAADRSAAIRAGSGLSQATGCRRGRTRAKIISRGPSPASRTAPPGGEPRNVDKHRMSAARDLAAIGCAQ